MFVIVLYFKKQVNSQVIRLVCVAMIIVYISLLHMVLLPMVNLTIVIVQFFHLATSKKSTLYNHTSQFCDTQNPDSEGVAIHLQIAYEIVPPPKSA